MWATTLPSAHKIRQMEHIETLENLEKFLGLALVSYEPVPWIEHPGIRISHACENIARHIKSGDQEAARIGCRIIVTDPHLPFGKLIKSGIARALKQRIELLSAHERASLVDKTVELLSLQFCPREAEDYCKAVKRIGPSAVQDVINSTCATNDKSKRLLNYLRQSYSN